MTQLSPRTTVLILSALTGVVALVAVFAFVLGSGTSPQAANGGSTETTAPADAPPTTLPESEFVTFREQQTGYRIDHPREWKKLPPEQPGELVLYPGTAGDLVIVRFLQRTEVPTTVDNVANINALTDGLVTSDKSVRILLERQVTVNGMPGYYYLYTFTEPQSGATGAHAHYFLFRGRKMYSMVFQALPEEGFDRLAPVFDQIAASFDADPDLEVLEPPTPPGQSQEPPPGG